MDWVRRLLVLCAVGCIPPAAAADLEIGVGLDMSKDLGDPGLALPESRMGVGILLRGPVRLALSDVIVLRADPLFGVSGGQDRVEWSEYGGRVRYHSQDHWTLLSQLGVVAGPELRPWPALSAMPYFGTSVGAVWARHWHSFSGDTAILLDSGDEGLDREGHIDPYTDQLAPMVGIHGGVRLADLAPFAIEVEAGYNVAFMSSAPLQKARPGLGAVRTAYGLNLLRVGVNAVFTLPKGTKP
jgi:hypothetical protein